jgi:hypothetical protein
MSAPLRAYAVSTHHRRRDAEEAARAVAASLNETVEIKRLNPFGDGYSSIGLFVSPTGNVHRREAS